jgi:hypothetical protein
MVRRTATLAALAALALAAAPARADPRPIRVDYQAIAGCPGENVFLDEIRWRTSLARLAEPGEEALAVEARITRRGGIHHGRLALGTGPARVVREIEGAVCDEVVSALALVTALAVDPRASLARRPPPPPSSPPPPSPSPAPAPPAAESPGPAPTAASSLPPPDPIGAPLPVLLSPAPPEGSWALAASAWTDVGIAPRPLFGGAVAAEQRFGGRWAPSIQITGEAGGTGSFDAGPGGASFVKVAGRLWGCAFPWRPAAWLTIVPCLAAEGGVLHAEAVTRGSLTRVDPVTVPWAAAGALPRIALGSGRWTVEIAGGPVAPLLRQSFSFTNPSYVVSTLPPVMAHVGLGGGVRFP